MIVSHILPRLLRNDPLWRGVFEAADEVVGGPLQARIDALAKRFNIDVLAPPPTDVVRGDDELDEAALAHARQLAHQLGYHYPTSMAGVTLLRFLRESLAVPQVSGTEDALNFVGYLTGVQLKVIPLWYDESAEDFYAEDNVRIQGRRLGLDGNSDNQNVWSTPYVDIEVDVAEASRDISDVLAIFEAVANINLVVRAIYTRVTTPVVPVVLFPTVLEHAIQIIVSEA